MKLEDLFGEETSERIKTVKATEHRIPKVQPIQDGEVKRREVFEQEVFRYFIKRKKELEITEVYPFANMCVDGALKLNSGKAVALEIKQSLNWLLSCNARIEIQRLQKDSEKWDYFTKKVSKILNGALIVFKEFSFDWRVMKKGWRAFYEEEATIGIPTIPIRIAQLTQEKLEFGEF